MSLFRTRMATCLVIGLTAAAWAQSSTDLQPRPGREASPAVVNPAIRSALRATLNLDGPWDFAIDPKLCGESQQWYLPDKPLPGARKLQVPGCWEAQGVGEAGLSSANNKHIYEPVNVKLRAAYRGAAWYKKQVAIPSDWAGKQLWLKLGGVNAQGWVWVNGQYVAQDWAYCGSWKYNVTDLVVPGQAATVAVLARNDVPSRRGEANCMRLYGGIQRSVEFEATPAVLVDNAYVEPLLDQGTAKVHVTLRNTAATAAGGGAYVVQVSVSAIPDGQSAGQGRANVSFAKGPVTELTVDVPLDPCRPWSPESPQLYKAEVVLEQSGRPVDGWVERFGMKKYEVRGGDLYLNNVRYYLRGYGDDYVYPVTVCSPASRSAHAEKMRIAKQYGFNYVRHHTHCEIPEYYEAADEVGIMVQPELPYYGCFGPQRPYSHMSGAPLMAKDDLQELVAHYRRYTSLAMHVGGNEGYCPTPLDKELFHLAKRLDPSRPWMNLDGGRNSRENSEVNCYGYGCNFAPLADNTWPHIKHEYLSLGINEDPRLESKFTGAYAPTQTVAEVRKFVTEKVGLDWKWAPACFDAGYRLQGIWHKIGLEMARIDPYVDGFSCWLMTDISPSTQCGVLDMFWGQKTSTPTFFREFNAPTVILAQPVKSRSRQVLGFDAATLIHSEGDTLEVDWVVAHFQPKPVENDDLVWRVEAEGKTLTAGKVERVKLAAGTVATVGRSRITMPAVTKAVKARLVGVLESAQTANSWNVWIFPKHRPQPEGGNGIAASPRLLATLAPRYPGLTKLGTPEAKTAKLVVAASIAEPGVVEALEQGKNVVCLSLPGYNTLRPGTTLAVWAAGISNQTGTAIAAHPAFGHFPHEGYLDQGWFRLVDRAEKLDPGSKLRQVEPLMVGIGRAAGYSFGTLGYPLGFNLYVFQARVGQGRLLASGLNLSSENPEAVYLLDQFLRYAASPQFNPQGTLDLAGLKEQMQVIESINGWSETIKASETTEWHTFVRTAPMFVVRQLKEPGSVTWKTGRWKPDAQGMVTFRWIANLGWRTQPAGGKFTFYLGKEKLFDFDITLKSTEWKSPDGKAVLRYTVKSLDRNEDSSGIMELTIQAALLTPGEPAQLRVEGSGPNSRRYFGLQESP